MKKILKLTVAAVVLAAVLTAPASAVTAEECRQAQEAAHQMAECARQLGFPEDHIIIQTAQEKWWEAFNAEQDLAAQKCDLIIEEAFVWDGPVLTKRAGTVQGPSGKETYYNLPMQGVVNRMRRLGYDSENWPYWIREDGAKCLGPYILCAASFDIRPVGTILETSRGKAIVADTGSFARSNPTQIDLAMQW